MHGLGWLRTLRYWFDEYRRSIDIRLLWPVCKQNAKGDLELARNAFRVHAFMDPLWLRLGGTEIIRRTEELK